MKKMLKTMLAAVGVMCMVQLAPANAAYPERPVRLIVPFSAGGPNDIMARLVAEHMGKRLGQDIPVNTKSGEEQLISDIEVLGIAAYGYALIFTTNSFPTFYQ